MLKRFNCWFRRYYGELKDDFDTEWLAESRMAALLFLVADLKGIPAGTVDEACQKAKAFVDVQLGEAWTVDDFLDADIEIWPDYSTCYKICDVQEMLEGDNDRESSFLTTI